MIKFKTLNTDFEYEQFAANYAEAFTSKSTEAPTLTAEAVKQRTKVIGIFKDNSLVGGYALSDYPHTCFAYITEENSKNMLALNPLDAYCDLGAIWKSGQLCKPLFNMVVWPRIIIDTIIFSLGKKHILGYGYNAHGRMSSYSATKPIFIQQSEESNGVNIFAMTKLGLLRGFAVGAINDLTKPTKKRWNRIVNKLSYQESM